LQSWIERYVYIYTSLVIYFKNACDFEINEFLAYYCEGGIERFNYWGVLKGLGSIFQALKLISIPPSITNTLCPAPLPNFRSKYLLVFSAHCHDVLSKNIQQLERVLPKYNLLDIAYTLGLHRSRLSFGNYATVNSTLDLSSNISVAVQKRSGPQKLAFVFTGQGAQWLQMGIELVHEFPSFLATIRSLDVVLRELPDGPQWTLECKNLLHHVKQYVLEFSHAKK
jgi:hypothetical protein